MHIKYDGNMFTKSLDAQQITHTALPQ